MRLSQHVPEQHKATAATKAEAGEEDKTVSRAFQLDVRTRICFGSGYTQTTTLPDIHFIGFAAIENDDGVNALATASGSD